MTNDRVTLKGERLMEIRAKLLLFGTETDTSTWEAAFFLNVLEEKNREIRRLKATCAVLHRALRHHRRLSTRR